MNTYSYHENLSEEQESDLDLRTAVSLSIVSFHIISDKVMVWFLVKYKKKHALVSFLNTLKLKNSRVRIFPKLYSKPYYYLHMLNTC